MEDRLKMKKWHAKWKVLERTEYGVRDETADDTSYVASWSNGSQKWFLARRIGRVPKGKTIKLDANMVLIHAANMGEAEEVVSSLPMLPLYMNSTEAWMRGQTPRTDAQLRWALLMAKKNKEKAKEELKKEIK